MRGHDYKTHHETLSVNGLDVFYRHAGDRKKPALLMLHGFPTSSHMYRKLIEPLADTAYVVAPDLPGFGFSAAPALDQFDYTFENLADTIEAFVTALGLDRFFLFVNDFGTPVGYHLATRRPDRIRGLIIQNGNAHEEGLGPQWDASKAFFADPTESNRAKLPEWLNFEGTRYQYIGDVPERLRRLYPPECWYLDWERMSRPGNTDIQFEIFKDYRSHIARFRAIQAYHREHQPPCCSGGDTTASSICRRSWPTAAISTPSRFTFSKAGTCCWKRIIANAWISLLDSCAMWKPKYSVSSLDDRPDRTGCHE